MREVAMPEVLVVGAGPAGLALAEALARQPTTNAPARRLVVVDDPAAHPAPAGWGYWSAVPSAADAACHAAFDRIAICGRGRTETVTLAPYRYRMLTRDRLRAVVRERLAALPGVEFVDRRCLRVVDRPDHAEVDLGDRVLTARWVFDSTGCWPAALRRSSPRRGHRMVFTGWQVATAVDTFDPDLVVLCDFRLPAGRAAFVHVVPQDARHALVEHTAYLPPGGPGTAVDDELARYLELWPTGGYRITGTESGTIPLRPWDGRRAVPVRTRRRSRRHGRHVLPIGAAAGLVRAAGGYGLDAVHRDAAAVAGSLRAHGHPFAVASPPWRHAALDAIFLRALEREPQVLEAAFLALFGASDPLRVLRFLDHDSGWADDLRMIAGMPVGPFLRALLLPATRASSHQ